MRIMMVIASGGSYLINEALAKARYATASKMNFEAPLTQLVWLTSIVSVVATYIVSNLLIADLGDGTLWWKLATIITCGTLAGAIIPELVKIFTSVESSHVKEVVASSREGGASLNILSGLVAGNFSAYWIGLSIVAPDDDRVLRQRREHVDVRPDARAGGVCVRPGRLRLPRHGAGDDRRRLLRARDRQRPVGLRAVGHRRDPGHPAGAEARLQHRRASSSRPRRCSRRTTAPATPSRPPPSRCSSAPRWSARRR